jgi:SH3-like domain-containing protein
MRAAAALVLALVAASARAATAYVSDELVLNVYAEQNQQGQRLATLHSGASVETLAAGPDYTQIRLSDGTTGWVKSAYLTTQVPATVRVKQLQDELDRSRATTPALAEAAAKSEVERLQRALESKQSELDATRAAHADPAAPPGRAAPRDVHGLSAGVAAGAVLFAGACGFWLGYVTLARKIRQKFGGIRVY